jgi:hypothetical protein
MDTPPRQPSISLYLKDKNVLGKSSPPLPSCKAIFILKKN